jgi:GNAT superfamily N-acetyltransferase
VPEGRTALPAIDRALPTLELFGRIVGRHWTRYKIALLKDLQGHGIGRWRINEIKELAWWLEQSSTTDLVGELRDAGALIYEPLRGY